MAQNIILGTPFLNLLMPITKIDTIGIHTELDNQKIIFEFITSPYTKELDQVSDLLSLKQNQINFLQKEISFLTTEQRIQQNSFQQKIKLIEKEFQDEICSDVPNAFWDRKKHLVSLPYEPTFDEKKIPTKGLVQIALKPLTLLGQNTSMQCTLRDGRCLNWRASLMGAMETSLSHGPVYFDIYPNLSIALSDQNLSKVLEFRILTNGYEYMAGSPPFSVISRIYLKVLTTLNPYVRKKGVDGETVLIDTNLYSSQVAAPRLLEWDKITVTDKDVRY